MGYEFSSSARPRVQPIRTAAHVSLAAVAAIVVVPICVTRSTQAAGGSEMMTRAAKCILSVDLVGLDPAPECFAEVPALCVPMRCCNREGHLVAEPIVRSFVTITRIGSRHGP